MNKLKAFTLLELLIGMLISSLMITFCYTGYSLIYRHFLNYKSIKEEIITSAQLHAALNNDFITSKTINFDADVLTLTRKSAPPLLYIFKANNIIRTDNQTSDVFYLKTRNIKPITLDTSPNMQSPYLVSLSFETLFFNESKYFYFSKRYSATSIISEN